MQNSPGWPPEEDTVAMVIRWKWLAWVWAGQRAAGEKKADRWMVSRSYLCHTHSRRLLEESHVNNTNYVCNCDKLFRQVWTRLMLQPRVTRDSRTRRNLHKLVSSPSDEAVRKVGKDAETTWIWKIKHEISICFISISYVKRNYLL